MTKSISLFSAVLLLSACATPTYQEYILHGSQEGVEYLYQNGYDINTLEYWGSPLAVAARTNNVVTARYLIDKGADVDLGNAEGYESRTPLHSAAANNAVDVARLLIKNGARTDLRNNQNQTPLELARDRQQQGMIDLLTEYAVEQTAWVQAKQEDSSQAYALFLETYPQSPNRGEAETLLYQRKLDDKERQRKQQQLAQLESSLPPTVRRDKLMIQLSEHLKNSDFQQALVVFPKLEQLPVDTDPSLKFFYGEALLETGKPDEALEKFYQYINEQGAGAKHYARALALINKAESQL